MTWNSCKSGTWPKPPARIGDEYIPCFTRTISITDVKNGTAQATVHANPLLYSDIPHNRFMRNPRNLVVDGDGETYRVREWFDDDEESLARDTKQGDYADIVRDDQDDDWVKCQDNGTYEKFFTMSYREYIKKFIEYRKLLREDPLLTFKMPIANYAPTDCNYPSLIDQFPNGNAGPAPVSHAEHSALLNNWISEF